MQPIDFLPREYRDKTSRRSQSPQRWLVLVVVGGLLAASLVSQNVAMRNARRDLADVIPAYQAARKLNDELGQLQSKLHAAQASADLFAYLRHPWPRTQILSAVAADLPSSITFKEVRIAREAVKTTTTQAPNQPPIDRQTQEQQLAKLPASTRDLLALREQCDATQTVVILTGFTSDGEALHRHLGRLGRAPLFSKAELRSLDSEGADGKRLRFNACLVVRPGYGQPGGPTGPAPSSVSQASPAPEARL